MDPEIKILIVDDEMNFLISMKGLLTEIGYKNIFVASDGEAALAFCRTEIADLILLDVIMPGTNGWDVATELRSRDYPAVIIFTSVDDTAEFGMRAAKVGADDFIPKSRIHQQFEIRADRAFRIRANSKGDTGLSLLMNSIENLRSLCQQYNCPKDVLDAVEVLSDFAGGRLSGGDTAKLNVARKSIDFISNSLANTTGNLASAAIIGAIAAIVAA